MGKKILENETFKILLLDIKIPGLNGFEILKWLKARKHRIKIMVLTGMPLNRTGHITDVNHEEEDLLNYADEVINKPSKIENMLIKINSLL